MRLFVRSAGMAGAMLVGALAACDDDEATAPNVTTERFEATLTGANERPTPVTTSATGTAVVILFGNDSASYDVKIGQIDSVTASHIHVGDANSAGGIMFGWPNVSPPANFPTLTQFHLGKIRRTSTFSGIYTFDSLVTRLRAGTAYVNVHTRRNPGGEIRGNLVKK